MAQETMNGYGIAMQQIMSKYGESFGIGTKSLDRYFSMPNGSPIEITLIDNTLQTEILQEVERYYKVLKA